MTPLAGVPDVSVLAPLEGVPDISVLAPLEGVPDVSVLAPLDGVPDVYVLPPLERVPIALCHGGVPDSGFLARSLAEMSLSVRNPQAFKTRATRQQPEAQQMLRLVEENQELQRKYTASQEALASKRQEALEMRQHHHQVQ